MKGQYKGSCNITACQKENSAFWYNHFNQMYYCEDCANRLNNDEFNKRSAFEKLGHNMCTNDNEIYYPLAVGGSSKSHSMIKVALDKHESSVIVDSEEGVFSYNEVGGNFVLSIVIYCYKFLLLP